MPARERNQLPTNENTLKSDRVRFCVTSESGKEHSGEVIVMPGGLVVSMDGHTNAAGDPGLVLIDCLSDSPSVLVWSDPEREDPTHSIEVLTQRCVD